MDYDVNAAGEGLQQSPETQSQYQGYAPVYKRPWFWIAAAAALAIAGALIILLAPGGATQRHELTGNAGVVAAYDFFCGEQESRDKLASPVMKEIGERLKDEPFEIECTANMDLSGMRESALPIKSVGFGIYAKYDLKDFGVRIGALGVDLMSAYLIDDDIVVSLTGRTGSMPVKLPEGVNIKKDMGIGERVKAFLPFLPEDEVWLTLLDKFAGSVPDKYTAENTAMVYSPKDDKEVRMDVIETTLDPQALKEVILNFAGGVKDDKKLLKQLQDITDKFTEFAGLESQDIEGLIKEFESSAGTQDFKDIELSWSVYKRNGSFAGISFEVSAESLGTDYKYTYITEFEGSDIYVYGLTELNGAISETNYKSSWNGDKIKLSGETKTTASGNAGSTTQLIEAEMEFSKDGGNEYSFTGDFTINGNVYNDMLNPQDGQTIGMKLDADIALGGGLGTLKEDREWNSIYDKEWGSMEDLFGSIFPGLPGGSYFDIETGSTFMALTDR